MPEATNGPAALASELLSQQNPPFAPELPPFVPAALARPAPGLSLAAVRHPHNDQLAARFTPPAATAAEPAPSAERAELTAIVLRAQAGDLDAQSQLVRRYTHRIAGFVRTFVRDPNAIDDVTQNVFVKMVRRLKWLREAISFESWLFAMARSTALDFLRSRARRPEVFADDLPTSETADPSRPALLTEIMEALDLALAELSPKDRTLVQLVVEGHSYDFIAAREGLTVGAVKARLTRVRPFLRTAVGVATGTRLAHPTESRHPRLTRLAA